MLINVLESTVLHARDLPGRTTTVRGSVSDAMVKLNFDVIREGGYQDTAPRKARPVGHESASRECTEVLKGDTHLARKRQRMMVCQQRKCRHCRVEHSERSGGFRPVTVRSGDEPTLDVLMYACLISTSSNFSISRDMVQRAAGEVQASLPSGISKTPPVVVINGAWLHDVCYHLLIK